MKAENNEPKSVCLNCELAKRKKAELLETLNSPLDAVINFEWWLSLCKKTCPFFQEKGK